MSISYIPSQLQCGARCWGRAWSKVDHTLSNYLVEQCWLLNVSARWLQDCQMPQGRARSNTNTNTNTNTFTCTNSSTNTNTYTNTNTCTSTNTCLNLLVGRIGICWVFDDIYRTFKVGVGGLWMFRMCGALNRDDACFARRMNFGNTTIRGGAVTHVDFWTINRVFSAWKWN